MSAKVQHVILVGIFARYYPDHLDPSIPEPGILDQ